MHDKDSMKHNFMLQINNMDRFNMPRGKTLFAYDLFSSTLWNFESVKSKNFDKNHHASKILSISADAYL